MARHLTLLSAAMIALTAIVAIPSTAHASLTGTSDGLGHSKIEACRNAKRSAETAIGIASIGKNVVRERIGSCDCEQGASGLWTCLVGWGIDVG